MAGSLMRVPPVAAIRSCDSTSGHQKFDSIRRSCWTPLFSWFSEPDYIVSENDVKTRHDSNTLLAGSEIMLEDQRSSRSRISSGSFTEQKARKLRMLTTGRESFHDAMYHSAIASRLASDFSDRSDL